ncbi:histidine--tRNA ligase [Mycetocola lacteus]|uniref:Histidine--tRNA ligase n=1 Tax=Mycetocola lacteus TaxID=76637 RepID=A0A3L7ALF4_9MICO|nr:histidine--tRNA ligase [Mycetocola lacteus]RLP80894.1 histidine--tRNA ligase [Mycetocola lacteus]RLP84679.1 histidine--tRNA ligase [Mycetocola lacteus]
MATVSAPRGMRDFLPAEKARREHALSVIRRVYRRFGFDEIETPVLENYDRLHSGLGGDNEKISFNVLKRGIGAEELRAAAESDDLSSLTDLGLRFDLTVPLARYYATHRAELPSVFRSVQIAPVWRAERPQKGRYRQFVQSDIDIIGEAGILAEIELIGATTEVLRELGITGTRVRINDRRLITGMLEAFGFAPEEFSGVLITIDKLDKIAAAGVIAELRERGVTAAAIDALAVFLETEHADTAEFSAESIAARLPAGVDPEVIAELAQIGASTESDLVFDPFLVRGMGYYTGPIFEIEHADFGYALGGGGRYDGMIGRFLGQEVPAVGFSIGFERIVDLIEADAASAEESLVLIYDRNVDPAALIALKNEVAASGTRVRLDKRAKNFRAVLERAAEAGYTAYATVSAETSGASDLDVKPLGAAE